MLLFSWRNEATCRLRQVSASQGRVMDPLRINIGNTFDYPGMGRAPEEVEAHVKWAQEQGPVSPESRLTQLCESFSVNLQSALVVP